MWRSHFGKNLVIAVSLLFAGFAIFTWVTREPVELDGKFTDGQSDYEDRMIQRPRVAVWTDPANLGPQVNSEGAEGHPFLHPDGRRFFFQVGKVGEGSDIWEASWDGQALSDLRPLGLINTDADEASPTTDGRYLYFASNRRGGAGGLDLYRSEFEGRGYGPVESLGAPINSVANDSDPIVHPITGDLFLSSQRSRSGESWDIFHAPKTSSGFGVPVAIQEFNSSADDRYPSWSKDGGVFWFSSDRQGGRGGFDLYRAVWTKPETLQIDPVDALNSEADDIAACSFDGGFGVFFASSRDGDSFGLDLFAARSRELFVVPQDRWRWLDVTQVVLLLLVALLAFLAKKWSALEVFYKCILASVVAHILLMLWFRTVEVEGDFPEPSVRAKTFRVSLSSDWNKSTAAASKAERGEVVDRIELPSPQSIASKRVTPTELPNLATSIQPLQNRGERELVTGERPDIARRQDQEMRQVETTAPPQEAYAIEGDRQAEQSRPQKVDSPQQSVEQPSRSALDHSEAEVVASAASPLPQLNPDRSSLEKSLGPKTLNADRTSVMEPTTALASATDAERLLRSSEMISSPAIKATETFAQVPAPAIPNKTPDWQGADPGRRTPKKASALGLDQARESIAMEAPESASHEKPQMSAVSHPLVELDNQSENSFAIDGARAPDPLKPTIVAATVGEREVEKSQEVLKPTEVSPSRVVSPLSMTAPAALPEGRLARSEVVIELPSHNLSRPDTKLELASEQDFSIASSSSSAPTISPKEVTPVLGNQRLEKSLSTSPVENPPVVLAATASPIPLSSSLLATDTSTPTRLDPFEQPMNRSALKPVEVPITPLPDEGAIRPKIDDLLSDVDLVVASGMSRPDESQDRVVKSESNAVLDHPATKPKTANAMSPNEKRSMGESAVVLYDPFLEPIDRVHSVNVDVGLMKTNEDHVASSSSSSSEPSTIIPTHVTRGGSEVEPLKKSSEFLGANSVALKPPMDVQSERIEISGAPLAVSRGEIEVARERFDAQDPLRPLEETFEDKSPGVLALGSSSVDDPSLDAVERPSWEDAIQRNLGESKSLLPSPSKASLATHDKLAGGDSNSHHPLTDWNPDVSRRALPVDVPISAMDVVAASHGANQPSLIEASVVIASKGQNSFRPRSETPLTPLLAKRNEGEVTFTPSAPTKTGDRGVHSPLVQWSPQLDRKYAIDPAQGVVEANEILDAIVVVQAQSPLSLIPKPISSASRTNETFTSPERFLADLPDRSPRPLTSVLDSITRDTATIPAERRDEVAASALPDLYRGRFGVQKELALEEFGGSEETELAVKNGLAYLASIQDDSGYWGNRSDYDEKYHYVLVGKSALALLAFLGAGHTPDSNTQYSELTRKTIQVLVSIQDEDTGHFGFTTSYSHGVATYALAECYALTRDPGLRAPLERAVDRIVSQQFRDRRDPLSYGGWSYYYPDGRSYDRFPRASITSWQVMALKSARIGGIDVDDRVFDAAKSFLTHCYDDERGWFLYNHDPSRKRSKYPTLPGSTPASTFALELMGVDLNETMMQRSFEYIMERKPKKYRWRGDDQFVYNAEGNLYFWYYGTLALFTRSGADWVEWNEALKTTLLPAQNRDGSWEPISIYARYAGDDPRDKSYSTAMCVLMLEVYYRYLTPLLQMR